MEIHQLRYFCAVARNGTFTRASEVEHVTQPSLSQQILKLEAELGARLFDRLPRSARLTVFGRTFLPKAERILRELGDAKTEMLEMAGHEKGDVVLAVIPTVASYLLPRVLTGFSQQHPQVAVKVIEDITHTLMERLRQGSADMAVVALPVPGDDLSCLELFEEGFFAVVPQGHPRARQKTVSLADLRNEPFLLLKEGHCFRDSLIAACRQSKVKPNVVFESGHFATILAMVSAGMGVSAVPAMAVQEVPGCRYIRISGNRSVRRIGLVKLRHHFETRAQSVLWKHVVSTCGMIPGARGRSLAG
jgi:LysR family transcriptional regulator, hydrogen peroxide-inducible genes activator